MIGLLAAIFAVLLILSVPVGFVVGLSSLSLLVALKLPLTLLPMQMVDGVNSFTLLAIPLFIMSGEVMARSGLTDRLLALSSLLVGRVRGSLAHVNVICSTIFAGMSGSAVADVSSEGPIIIPAMVKEGYGVEFSAAVTASTAIQGPIIPPSLLMVMYGAATGTSIGGMFAAGFIPGLLIGAGQCLIIAILAKKRNYPRRVRKIPIGEAVSITWKALPCIFIPLIILGGIFGGVFTPTESGGIAALYAVILTVVFLRTLKISELPSVALLCAKRATIVLFIIAGAQVLGYVFALLRIPTLLADLLLSVTRSRALILLLVNLILLFVGTFMDAGTSIILFAPIIAPVMGALGFHPLHTAIIIVLAIDIGLITPPVGVCLFGACAVSGVKLEAIVREIWPFIVISVIVLLLISFFPDLVLVVPRLIGFA